MLSLCNNTELFYSLASSVADLLLYVRTVRNKRFCRCDPTKMQLFEVFPSGWLASYTAIYFRFWQIAHSLPQAERATVHTELKYSPISQL